MEQYPIDFVITWVDGGDEKWLAEKEKYDEKTGDRRNRRYRDWDTLRFLFRSIEKNAEWVNTIYLITCGHLPKWLNTANPKLRIIRHSDYIPSEYLPTFSSRTIDMNFHRIAELSEHFVYFNDDMLLLRKTERKDFFRHGMPCDTAVLRPAVIKSNLLSRNETTAQMYLAPIVDMALINKHFKKHTAIRKNLLKWYAPVYGTEMLKTASLSIWNFFPGIRQYHCCYSYLKSTYSDLWNLEKEALEAVCKHRFRVNTDYNHWIFSYWQMASGTFCPRTPKFGFAYALGDEPEKNRRIYQALKEKRHTLICLNDNVSDEKYTHVLAELTGHLETVFPEKSSFEQ